jgi:hypothetical protein
MTFLLLAIRCTVTTISAAVGAVTSVQTIARRHEIAGSVTTGAVRPETRS